MDPGPVERERRWLTSLPIFLGVAAISAVLGFVLASRIQLVSAPAPTREALRPAERPPARAERATPRVEPRVAESPPPAPPTPIAPTPAPVPVAPTPAPVAPAPVVPEPVAPAPSPAAAAPATRPAPTPAPRPAPDPVEKIEISINASPWAVIEIDGEEIGETPLGGVSVDRGAHRFVARFPDGRVVERTVEVDPAHRTLVFE